MIKKTKIVLSLIGSLILLTQCSVDQGNPVGSQFFPRGKGEEYKVIFQAAQTDTFYQTYVNNSLSPYLYVGSASNIETISLILFNLPDSGTMDSGFVKLYLGDPIGSVEIPFPITIQLITEDWSDSLTNWENFNTQSQGEELFSGTVTVSETDSFVFDIPPRIINGWIDSTIANYGLMISSSSTESIIQFYSGNEQTYLKPPQLLTTLKDDTTGDLQQYLPYRDRFLATTSIEPNGSQLIIANGTAIRSILHFNIETIPSPATINRALLCLSEYASYSPFDSSEFIIYAYPIDQLKDPFSSIITNNQFIGFGEVTSGLVKINITDIVQQWSASLIKNEGILLSGINETIDLCYKIFNSTDADSSLQPYLEVYYSTPPERKY